MSRTLRAAWRWPYLLVWERSAHRSITGTDAHPAGRCPAVESANVPTPDSPLACSDRPRQWNGGRPAHFFSQIAILLLLLCLAGCRNSSPRGQVSGTLTIDKVPVQGILITFIATADEGPFGRAQGLTDADGHYVLHGEDQRPGTVIGDYVVVLQDMAIYDAPRDAEGTVVKHPPRRFPTIFERPETTPLKAHVLAGVQTIHFEIPSR